MARPTTDELKYYSRDTKQQENEQYIEAVHGRDGFYILEKLRMHIYGSVHGYYCDFKDIHKALFCKNNGNLPIDLFDQVLADCFLPDIELFDKDMYENYKILTSDGIQKRWKKIVIESGRKNTNIKPEYCLLPEVENTDELPLIGGGLAGKPTDNTYADELTGGLQGEKQVVNGVQSGVSPTESTQMKLNESKLEESKEKENQGERGPNPLATPSKDEGKPVKPQSEGGGGRSRRPKLQPPGEAEATDYFKTATRGTMHPAAAEMQAKKFLAHYGANGWVQNGNKAIVDWKAAANGWLLRDLGGDYSMKGGVIVKAPPTGVTSVTSDTDIAREVEYLYQRYLENQLDERSLLAKHYDYLKKTDLATLSEKQKQEIRQEAVNIRIKSLEGSNEGSTLRLYTAYVENKPANEEPIKSDQNNLYVAIKKLCLKKIFELARDAGEKVIIKDLAAKK